MDHAAAMELCLYDNQIGDQGAAALAPALGNMTQLQKLYLNGNKIGNQGAAALASVREAMQRRCQGTRGIWS